MTRRAALYGLLAAWVALGLAGHDPWKPDEAYSFGLVYHILETGDWLVPTLAGEPFMEKPPLYFITAAAFAKLFGGLAPPHDAARLASAFYVSLTLFFIAKTARSVSAPLLLVASLGYVHHAHQLITDNALVAGIAVALYGMAISLRKPLPGGLWLGTGAGIAFLSKGLLGPGLLGLTAVALLAFPAWRTKNFLQSWLWAAAAFAPWALVWPWLLYRHSPELFHEWLWVQNLGRFSGVHRIGGVPDHWHYVKSLPWFALPAWPIALWALWRRRTDLLHDSGIQLPLAAFLVMFAVLSASSLARQLYALPMLIPLAILAAGGVDSAPAWLGNLLEKPALWGAAIAGAALWAGWIALQAGWAGRLESAYPGYVARIDPLWLALAIAVTVGWFFAIRSKELTITWAAGVTLVWGLAMTIWLPFLDHAKSYRGMIAEMQRSRPAPAGCVASRDLSEPQRAVFHYFAGIRSLREGSSAARDCPLLLVHTSRDAEPPHGAEWQLLWRGSRPGDKKETFWLFTRAG